MMRKNQPRSSRKKKAVVPWWKKVVIITLIVAMPLFFWFIRNMQMQSAVTFSEPAPERTGAVPNHLEDK